MRTLFLDMSCLAHSAMHRCRGTVAVDDAPVAITVEILNHVLSLGERFKTNLFCFAFDGAKHANPRFSIFPEYKEKRGVKRQQETEEDKEYRRAMYRALDDLLEILPEMGFTGVLNDGIHESDDHIARNLPWHLPAVIVSTDGDMLQCINRNAAVFNPQKNKLITEQEFYNEFRIIPSAWARVKTLAGCDSDEVPGVPGVGVKTALKYILGQLKPTSKAYIAITENKAIIARNAALVCLPYPSTPVATKTPSRITRGTFTRACTKWGLDMFLMPANLERWSCLFRGIFEPRKR